MISTLPKKGHLLIAEPSILGDVSFNRSVILLAEHNDEGSIGFILNKPLNYSINDLIPEIDAAFKIYNGGPVEQDNLYFIHNIPEIIPNSIEISNGIYWRGVRTVPFSKELWIEREDFMENPPKKYFRLAPGQMVRLKSAYIIKCEEVIKDDQGNIMALHCTYIPESKSGSDSSGIHVKGTLHWGSAAHAIQAEVRLYDRLF